MVLYEWDIEVVASQDSEANEEGEVLDHYHCDSYKEALLYVGTVSPPPGCRFEIVLVRDSDFYRSWAYVTDGKLAERFTDAEGDDCTAVPVRFIREVARGTA